MLNVGTGVRVQYCSLRSTIITGNRIDCNTFGIYAAFNDAATRLFISGNVINLGYNLVTASKGSGIYVNEQNINNANTAIGDNHLQIKNAANGIYLRNLSRATIGYNTVELANSIKNNYGISLSGCANNSVSCNYVTSVGIGAATSQRGVFVSSSTNCNVACNRVDNTYHGIRLDGICGGTLLYGNNINNHRNGLFFGTTTIIGNQINGGNEWNGSCSNFGALHAGNYQLSLFYINPFSSPYLPPSISPATSWFLRAVRLKR